MDSTFKLSDIFDISDEEPNMQYQIQNFENIPNLFKIFEKNKETSKYPLNLEELTNIFSFLRVSFMKFRINTIYFNKYSNFQIYQTLIAFYLSNDYNSNELDEKCLNLIDILVNNTDISKSIIDSVIQKFANYYYSLEEPTPKYEYLIKLLKILNHLYGINLNIKKPKHYYYFSGLDKFDNNYINVPVEEPNQTMAITLWFKSYNNQKGVVFSLDTSKHNNIFKLLIRKNKLCLLYGSKEQCIIESDFFSNDFNNISFYYL